MGAMLVEGETCAYRLGLGNLAPLEVDFLVDLSTFFKISTVNGVVKRL